MAVPEYTPEELEREEWRPVEGFESIYTVSDLGRIKRIAPGKATRAGRVLNPWKSPANTGYLNVDLHNGKSTKAHVHLLVARAFLGPCPDGKEVNHKDLNKGNCRATNLEYITHLENMRHWRDNRPDQANRKGQANGRATLTDDKVRLIRASTKTQMVTAAEFGVDQTIVSRIKRGVLWGHVV